MRRERDNRDRRGGGGGRGRGGRGGGGGGGRGRGRNNNNNNNRRGGGGGGYNNRRGRSQSPSQSGNQRERIQVESGYMVLIDQFMLANPQFLEKMRDSIDEDFSVKDGIIKDYGGSVVELAPATYRIERDPYAFNIVVHPDGDKPNTRDLLEGQSESLGQVFIDTRCIAMFDRELLDDSDLLEKYKDLWFGGKDKACRDLLRDNGGAVRYGFQRQGDELGVYKVGDNIVALWPDVIEQADGEDQSAEQEAAQA